jgi:hypothetical protein
LPISPETAHARARKAALTRSRAGDDPDMIAAERDLHAANLADHIRRTVDAWPPLTSEQRDRLATLLRAPSTVDGGTAA